MEVTAKTLEQFDAAKIIQLVEQKHGKEAVTLLNAKLNLGVKTISSGSFIIDNILGVGGYPEGRIVEIFGPESSGKTTIALHAINEAQKLGKMCAFIDVEHALDPHYAKNIGIDVNKLIVSQPDFAEQALEIVDTLIKTDVVKLIVVDSVAALVPEAELAGEMSDNSIGLQARIMSKALRKITGSINKSNCVLIFVNQLREKVGTFFGNNEVTPGGRALKFYASIRMDVRRIQKIGTTTIEGNKIRVKIVKNKVAPPYRAGETKIMFSKGISRHSEVLQLAEDQGVVQRKGAYFVFEKENFAMGRKKAEEYLETHPEFYEKVVAAVVQHLQK